MMIYYIRLLLLFALLGAAGGSLAAAGPDCSRPMTLALHDHGLLYSTALDAGIDKDFAAELIKRSGCKVSVSLMTRARIWQLIESGALDFSLSGISNAEREKYAGFAWYFSNKYYLLVRKDANVRKLADFENNTSLQLGAIRSFRYSKNANRLVDKLHESGRISYSSGLDAKVTVLHGVQHIISAIRDNTEQHRAETELRLRGAALEATANAITITNTHGLIEWANPAFCNMTGYTMAETVDHYIRDLLKSGAQKPESYVDLWSTILAGKVWHGEFVNRRKDGTHYHEDQTVTPVHDREGAISHFVAVKQDIFERKLSEARMNELSRHLLELQEDARRRLASELHDRTSPNLAAISINLEVMAGTMLGDSTLELAARLEDTRALIEDTTASIREICADLRPPVLDYAGLLAALESYAHQFSRRTGIFVLVESSDCADRLSPELESALFRIAQEALTNCAKHANATTIRVAMRQAENTIMLVVEDNGGGFDPAMMRGAKHSAGLGIITMRELAEFSGGTFSIASGPGKGTAIRVEIDFNKGHA